MDQARPPAPSTPVAAPRPGGRIVLPPQTHPPQIRSPSTACGARHSRESSGDDDWFLPDRLDLSRSVDRLDPEFCWISDFYPVSILPLVPAGSPRVIAPSKPRLRAPVLPPAYWPCGPRTVVLCGSVLLVEAGFSPRGGEPSRSHPRLKTNTTAFTAILFRRRGTGRPTFLSLRGSTSAPRNLSMSLDASPSSRGDFPPPSGPGLVLSIRTWRAVRPAGATWATSARGRVQGGEGAPSSTAPSLRSAPPRLGF